MEIGINGSLAHVLTNDNMSTANKSKCLKEISKENLKDTLKITTVAAGAAGIGALASKSNRFVDVLKNVRTQVGNALSRVSIDDKNLKELIKNSNLYKNFNALPKPAKAAIATGSAILALILPTAAISSASKSGYIEGKHENK